MQHLTVTQNNKSDTLISPPAGKIFGIPVWGLHLNEFVELAKKLIKTKHKVLFTTLGAPSIVIAQKSTEFFNHFLQADVVLPDGILPVWIARGLKYKVIERVPGPDFVDLFLSVAEQEKFSIFFMGSTSDTLEKLRSNCLKKHPCLNIVGLLAPPFGEFDDIADHRLVDAINQAHSDVLFVGMTAPKQELWLSRNFGRLNVVFAMGVGAAFDYIAGNRPRVPKWLGRLGFEWLYRLILEPRRLWHRNLNNLLVVWLWAKNYLTGVFRRHIR
jgi:N-acetylglucosaminyldiphosphoundecaprenol N-acetyl-beta-D-mannosaminyltransferase